jgi:hypothetical protein
MTCILVTQSPTYDDLSTQPPLQERIHLEVEDNSLPAEDILSKRNKQDEQPGLFVP